jgi:hypothetical protein
LAVFGQQEDSSEDEDKPMSSDSDDLENEYKNEIPV